MKINLLERLNESQKEAVKHGNGPLLIIAGAGTGKTTVLTHRIAYLISQKLALPSEILALTFTDKAALEMEERVDILTPYGYNDVLISTFHSFGDRVLRQHALELGLDFNFKVLAKTEQIIFLKEHLFELPLEIYRPLGNPASALKTIVDFISRLKDEDITPAEFLNYSDELLKNSKSEISLDLALRYKELANLYDFYQRLTAKYGFLDFGDQVNLTLKLFRTFPSILKKYQKQFKFILIDEFQDTNFAQYQLVKLLSWDHQNITVVGDDDQSIYKFRGAAISNILNFALDFSNVYKVVLNLNYRSGQNILEGAYRLILHNNPERLEVKQNIDK
ncbi:MAG: UvrD-helicase domain-containing protein, partial [Armatimonadetes bacterium]|nr:UvrD-helicase domain-containing protein [Armatimonadota bacterium]